MTPARDPKQCFLKGHLRGILETTWRHLRNIWYLRNSWEASRRHLGGIRHLGRHLGSIWEPWGIWGDIWKASGRHLEDIHRRFSPLVKWMSVGTLLGQMWHRIFLCMSRNKLKKAKSYLETCSDRMSLRNVFRKPLDNICWCFSVILRPILEQFWPWRDPWSVPGTTLGHLWTQTSKKYQQSSK